MSGAWSSATEDENPCWEGMPDFGEVVPDDYDDEDLHQPGTCDYCGAEPGEQRSCHTGEIVGPLVDPFGGRLCCAACWEQIVGGES